MESKGNVMNLLTVVREVTEGARTVFVALGSSEMTCLLSAQQYLHPQVTSGD